MKVLLSWLRDFVDVPGAPEEIAATMSVRGFAVDSVDPVEGTDGADAVLDFEITANRPDCMSIAGIAREVATAYGLQVRRPAVRGAAAASGPAEAAPGDLRLASLRPLDGAGLEVTIEAPDLCPRYVGAMADVNSEKARPTSAMMKSVISKGA